MNTKLITASALTGLIFTGAMIGSVSAQSAADATSLTEEQVIAIALAEVPGEVTEVDLERERGTQIFEVEVLAADGSEMEVEIDAETGDILKVKADGEHRAKDCDKDDDTEDA